MKKIGQCALILSLTVILCSCGWYNYRHYQLGRSLDDSALAIPVDQSYSAALSEQNSLILRFATYNVWALPVPLPGMEMSKRLPRIPEALVAVGAETYILQEAFDLKVRQYFASKLGAFNSYSDIECQRNFFPFGSSDCNGGLMTYSLLPMLSSEFHLHPLLGGAKFDERNGGKGFEISHLQTALGEFVLVNAHLYAGRNPEDEQQRIHQLQLLAAELARSEHSGMPIILAGDLNLAHPGISALNTENQDTDAYKFLTKDLNFIDTLPNPDEDDLTYDIVTNRYANIWYNRFENRQVFDYFLVRVPTDYSFEVKSRQRILTGEQTLSDHYGVLVELEFSRQY